MSEVYEINGAYYMRSPDEPKEGDEVFYISTNTLMDHINKTTYSVKYGDKGIVISNYGIWKVRMHGVDWIITNPEYFAKLISSNFKPATPSAPINQPTAKQEENLYTKNCIRTYTGIYLNAIHPEPHMFCKEDMAHSLSNLPRFNGHLKYYYSPCGNYSCTLSVAQHVCNGIDYILANNGRYEQAWEFAFHERGESSGLGDVAGPVKAELPDLKAMEANIERVSASVFNVPFPMTDYCKWVDKMMLEQEWNDIMLGGKPNYEIWFPHRAKLELLKRYDMLTAALLKVYTC